MATWNGARALGEHATSGASRRGRVPASRRSKGEPVRLTRAAFLLRERQARRAAGSCDGIECGVRLVSLMRARASGRTGRSSRSRTRSSRCPSRGRRSSSRTPCRTMPLTRGARAILAMLVCMVAARSSAMAFANRYMLPTGDVDARNPRTASRHIPRGTVSSGEALAARGDLGRASSSPPRRPSARCPRSSRRSCLAVLLGYSLAKRFTWGVARRGSGVALALRARVGRMDRDRRRRLPLPIVALRCRRRS